MSEVSEFPIIAKLGGSDAAFELVKARCGIQTRKTLEMWARRGRISGAGAEALWEEATARGIVCTPADFKPNGRAA